jgi:hypothetical protein
VFDQVLALGTAAAASQMNCLRPPEPTHKLRAYCQLTDMYWDRAIAYQEV